MSDFAGGIRKSVQAARESAKQQEDALRRQEEGEAGRQTQNKQRVLELPELMWARIREAEDAGDGAIKVERRSGTALTTFQLWWQEGQPERALQIVVDETEGVIQASWVVAPGYGQSVDAPSLEASRFDMAKLESAIELLVDQRRWSRGAIPMIPW
ncbi:MAG TPA: hypothetical protein VEQ11_17110 [Chloroflexota bacterium]|nr:hypothetical protein [Chloroflexota bacterium]